MAQLVEALRYKPEGRGFDSLFVSFELFIDTILPAALWPLGSTQPLTEMSSRNISWGDKGGRCVMVLIPGALSSLWFHGRNVKPSRHDPFTRS